jgi:RNA polymerase sigma-70 factor (ECF subfamily)
MVAEHAAPPDTALFSRACDGDPDALEALVRRHYRAAYLVALSATGNRADAEDVCHDGLIRAMDRLETCRQPDRFGAWLVRVVRNVAHNHRAYHRVRATEPIDNVQAAAPDDSLADAHRAELRERLTDALRLLPERQREVVLLHDLEGWMHREIAEALEISETMSRQTLFVARRALRERLGTTLGREESE